MCVYILFRQNDKIWFIIYMRIAFLQIFCLWYSLFFSLSLFSFSLFLLRLFVFFWRSISVLWRDQWRLSKDGFFPLKYLIACFVRQKKHISNHMQFYVLYSFCIGKISYEMRWIYFLRCFILYDFCKCSSKNGVDFQLIF